MSALVWTPDPDAEARLEEAGGAGDVRLETWDGGEPLASRDEVEVVVPPMMGDGAVLDALHGLPRLRLVQSLSAGVESLVDHVPPGVTLARAEGVHARSTAEWVVAATLAVLRDLPHLVRKADAGRWSPRRTGTLDGATVVVVGAGSIARHARDRLLPFECSVTLVGRSARDGVVAQDDLPALLPGADVVVLLVPLTDATRGLVGGGFLARMRDGAVLVNAARGAVVDTDALVVEVSSGRLRAALDVTDPEPLPAGHPLHGMPGVLLTPHVAGSPATRDARTWEFLATQLRRFGAGEELAGVVDLERGY